MSIRIKRKAVDLISARRDSDTHEINTELKEKVEELEKKYKEKEAELKKEIKGKDKLQFMTDKLGNDLKKEVAKTKSIYTQKENNLNTKYKNILTLIETLDKCSTLSEDDLTMLHDLGVDFFTAQMGAEAIKEVLAEINLENAIKELYDESESTNRSQEKEN
jgi:hypothetical protein